ncbi:LEA14-like dessication related protein [Litorivivens lipolytica]|uniref:LEA14-like dessication related protein n=1 Tax=Litorivivens lipolytica TaxID=1524264 RepID=A0A7W4W6F8_9GAMM|nr:LEA type 2 family protein [Litorivivens lipolytica]MBB3048336.1 LEA14-like dessication related protein [Litorivivens lipolytica]
MSLRSILKPLAKTSGFFVLALALLTSGCAWMRDAAKPEVSLTSLSLEPRQGFSQTLNVGVRVRNPNGFALNINKLNYRIFLEDSELAFGRRDELLSVPANDSVNLTVPVELNLFSGLKLAEKWLRNPKDALDYRLEVDADVANFGLGLMKIRKESTIKLTPER